MNISYYTAVSAMNAFQKDLDVTSNNMANISTNGYKSMRSSFNDLLYTQMDMRPQAQVGHGVRNDGPGTTFQQGIFRKTDRELDFAISGNAFFAIQTSEDEEEPAYTRDGAFQISSTDDGNYLTTHNLHHFLLFLIQLSGVKFSSSIDHSRKNSSKNSRMKVSLRLASSYP